jgi:alpha-tubulin suppressor-like RCC1 family protein
MVASPTQVGASTDWVDVAPGTYVTCARKVDNTIWCFGRNQETGTNNVDTLGVPTQISPDTDWMWVKSRWAHSCAQKADGRVFCWGTDFFGLDVIPGQNVVPVPTEIGTFDQFVMGGHHYCGIAAGTTKWACWGWNAAGQLGNGDAVSRESIAAALPLCTQG